MTRYVLKEKSTQLPLHEIYSIYDVNSKLDLFNEYFKHLKQTCTNEVHENQKTTAQVYR